MSITTRPPDFEVVLREELPLGSRIEQAINRLRQVFQHVTGLEMSVTDAARLTGLDLFLSQILLNALEDLLFIQRCGDGLYQRVVE